MTVPAVDAFKLDPFAEVLAGWDGGEWPLPEPLGLAPDWADPEVGVVVPGERCGEPGRFGIVCTRRAGHPAHWAHVAVGGWTVVGVWGGAEVPPAVEIVATPADDPAETPDVAAPVAEAVLGGHYRLRDTQTQVYLIGGLDPVRADGQLETLDLTHRRFRLVDPWALVAAEEALPREQFVFLMEWLAQQRQQTRDVAVQKYHDGAWCEAGLQHGLRDLGLERYEPTLHGAVTIRLNFEAPNDMPRHEIREHVLAAVDDPGFAAAFARLAEHDLVLNTEDIHINVGDFWRK